MSAKVSRTYHFNVKCRDKNLYLALIYLDFFFVFYFMTTRFQDHSQKASQTASKNNGWIIFHFKSVATKLAFLNLNYLK
jgi:hypothetical protein